MGFTWKTGGKQFGHLSFSHDFDGVLMVWRCSDGLDHKFNDGDVGLANLSLAVVPLQVESCWNDFIMAAQKSRGDWPSLRKRSQAMADAWELLELSGGSKVRHFLGSTFRSLNRAENGHL